MSAHPVSRLQWLSWGAAALAGTVGAYAASTLVASARSYCDAAWEPQHRFAHGFEWLVLTAAAAGLAVAAAVLARWATVRGPRSVRASSQVAVVLFVVTALAWWYVTAEATPAGYPGDSGLCPADNVPPWWPGWFPT
ncbi:MULTISPECIES: hypothetical protein [Streptomyces]|uniref:Integral membrane protein n=1 Tax=Streptomyces solicathayae TaxID=3081768 RepID=A0ABZ0LPV9_9ACTN|nr:hypothetical protein [Streptomyces sp. HUAS YS2]WOX21534.1 hypothetical protein R2D22_09045 [Streptomyces sp. HUAS YS2]